MNRDKLDIVITTYVIVSDTAQNNYTDCILEIFQSAGYTVKPLYDTSLK